MQWRNGTANRTINRERNQTFSKRLEAANSSIIQESIQTFSKGVGNSKHSIIQERIPFRSRHFSSTDKAQVGSNTSARNHAILQGHQVTTIDKHLEKVTCSQEGTCVLQQAHEKSSMQLTPESSNKRRHVRSSATKFRTQCSLLALRGLHPTQNQSQMLAFTM